MCRISFNEDEISLQFRCNYQIFIIQSELKTNSWYNRIYATNSLITSFFVSYGNSLVSDQVTLYNLLHSYDEINISLHFLQLKMLQML